MLVAVGSACQSVQFDDLLFAISYIKTALDIIGKDRMLYKRQYIRNQLYSLFLQQPCDASRSPREITTC
jgi:hypothetical protein